MTKWKKARRAGRYLGRKKLEKLRKRRGKVQTKAKSASELADIGGQYLCSSLMGWSSWMHAGTVHSASYRRKQEKMDLAVIRFRLIGGDGVS